jgi:hypothetical protein
MGGWRGRERESRKLCLAFIIDLVFTITKGVNRLKFISRQYWKASGLTDGHPHVSLNVQSGFRVFSSKDHLLQSTPITISLSWLQ